MSGSRAFETGVMVYRVQAADGRGPWRPGLSRYWVDKESDRPLPIDVITAFGLDWRERIPLRWHVGCACRTMDGLMEWFTPRERGNLDCMGYKPVSLVADRIIAENADQVIFVRRDPLTRAIALPWPVLQLEAVL